MFLTTHFMDEAQYLANRVAVIAAGQIVAEGPPSTLRAGRRRTVVTFRLPDGAPEAPTLGQTRSPTGASRSGPRTHEGCCTTDRLGAGARVRFEVLEARALAWRTSTWSSPAAEAGTT